MRRENAAGTPCRCPAMGNGRRRLHGGLSTAPQTAEGIERNRPAVGVKMKDFYMVTGQYDFVVVSEAPDDGVIGRAISPWRRWQRPHRNAPRIYRLEENL